MAILLQLPATTSSRSTAWLWKVNREMVLQQHDRVAYSTLHTGAVAVRLDGRRRIRISGAGAAAAVNGLVTNDVSQLAPGQGEYAAALTPKGKILADVRIFRSTDHLLVDTADAGGENLWSVFRKYVNPRLARYEDITATSGDLSVFGAQSSSVVSHITGLDQGLLAALGDYHSIAASSGEAELLVARIPDLGIPGYCIIADRDVCAALVKAARDKGALTEGVELALEIARVEAGRPRWGDEIDDATLVQEASLDDLGAVSWTKGCYTGQEVVARLHYRGHVNRLLRHVSCETLPLPARGDELVTGDGRVVGTVRTAVPSPRGGGIGMAMVRREVLPGEVLESRASAGQVERGGGAPVSLLVARLPFQSA
ncbi:MAG: CAF17-like 4Fe-4S cluster assembly/insertion protein YgfZ [Gemmatimonadota bacterium]